MGPHSKGSLFGFVNDMSMHHTMFIKNNSRNPRIAYMKGVYDHRYNYVHRATNTIELQTMDEGWIFSPFF